MTAWWTSRFQPYHISFEDRVLAASRELSVYHFMDRPWLLRGSAEIDRGPPHVAAAMTWPAKFQKLAVETPEFANDPDFVVVKRSALKNAVDSQKRCQQALKQAKRICTASAQAFNYEADVLGQCKAALERPL